MVLTSDNIQCIFTIPVIRLLTTLLLLLHSLSFPNWMQSLYSIPSAPLLGSLPVFSQLQVVLFPHEIKGAFSIFFQVGVNFTSKILIGFCYTQTML